jgi:hypothetical protein
MTSGFNGGIPEDQAQAIRLHLQHERALGHPRFQLMVEKALNRPAALRGQASAQAQRTPRRFHLSDPIQTDIYSGPFFFSSGSA